MAHLSQNNAVKESLTPSEPLAQSTNNLPQPLKRLSISAASATPSSPQASSPSRAYLQCNNSSASPNGKVPRIPLHRSPSSMSLGGDARSSTPTLLRKASMNSLHGVGGVTPSRDRTPSLASPSRRSSSASFINGSTLVGKSPLGYVLGAIARRF